MDDDGIHDDNIDNNVSEQYDCIDYHNIDNNLAEQDDGIHDDEDDTDNNPAEQERWDSFLMNLDMEVQNSSNLQFQREENELPTVEELRESDSVFLFGEAPLDINDDFVNESLADADLMIDADGFGILDLLDDIGGPQPGLFVDESLANTDLNIDADEIGISFLVSDLVEQLMDIDGTLPGIFVNDSLLDTYLIIDDVGFGIPYFLVDVGGTPPAAVAVLENLPVVECSKELVSDGVFCAICCDELVEGHMVNKLPCSHYFHAPCILPWLKMKNTCPTCRFELPTDDYEYESRRKMRRIGN